jgi:dUTP pyrophosphatase
LAIDFPIKLLSDRATLPTLGSDFAAGLDLYAAEEKTIPARGKALVDLQLSVAVPKGHYGRIAPRSGLGELQVELGASKGESNADNDIASKHSIQTGAGVIDADYRGPVMVLLFNHSDVDFQGMCSSLWRSSGLQADEVSQPQRPHSADDP